MGFFLDLFGFTGRSYQETQAALLDMATFTPVPTPHYFRERCDFLIDGGADQKVVTAGVFSTPSVADLRSMVRHTCGETVGVTPTTTTVQNIVGEARALHQSSWIEESSAVVQAASQFNYLEMPDPRVTPLDGIEEYEFDPTQGPACAVACAAGTAYRNYLVPVPFVAKQRRGQTKDSQLNGLELVEAYLGDDVPWVVKNGYVEAPDGDKLDKFNQKLLSESGLRDEFISRVQIGVQEDTAVTDKLSQQQHIRTVTQTYNSAISIGYSRRSLSQWEPVARTVLDATYEATLLVGILKTVEAADAASSSDGSKPPPILLTKVGGGVFGNKDAWIRSSIQNALEKVAIYGVGLDVRIVHFNKIGYGYDELER